MKKCKVLTSSAIVATMVLSSIAPAFAYSKEETVYSKLKTDGSEKTVIVSEHLKNDKDDKSLTDESSLTDIKNVNGDEKFTQDGETITWTTKDGEDIYYQGKTDKKLPISMKITYRLDGKEMKLNDMLGKKGDVEITIEYTNNEKTTVDGKEYYVPFVVGTTTMISTKNNSDVTVTNGKVISNGEKFVVGAVAAPGLYEDYDKNENLKDLNKVTITYKTKKFKLNSIMSAATPSLLSEDSLDIFNDLDEAYSKVDEMASAYDQILKGGEQLKSGVEELASKYSEFDSGVQSAAAGTSEAAKGAKTLSDGLATLNSKSAELNSGGSQVFAGVITLADQVLQSNDQLKTAGIKVPTLTTSNYKQVFSSIFKGLGTESITQKFEATVKEQAAMTTPTDKSIAGAKQQVTQMVVDTVITEQTQANAETVYKTYLKNNANDICEKYATQQVFQGELKAGVKAQLQAQGITNPTDEQINDAISKMTDDQKQAVVAAVQANMPDGQHDATLKGAIAQAKENQEQILAGAYAGLTDAEKQQIMEGAIKLNLANEQMRKAILADKTAQQAIIDNTVNAVLTSDAGKAQLNALIAKGNAATAQLQQLEALCAGSDALNNGISQYTAGVKQAYEGSKTLVTGLDKLNAGMKTLSSASVQVKAGIDKLNAGSGTLVTGMQAFNDQAINKLVDVVNNDIKGNVEKTETLLNISKDYKSFAGTKSDVESTTKFIMIVDGKSKK